MARSQAVYRAIKLAITGIHAEVQREFAATVQRELDAIQQQHRPSSIQQWVDGVPNKPVAQIDPFGRAVFQFQYWDLVLKDALEILRATSPVDTGSYRASHNVYLPTGDPLGPVVVKSKSPPLYDPASIFIPPGTVQVVIAPSVPYARVIEEGMAGKKPWSKQPQVPLVGVYRNATTAIQRRWTGVVLARLEWMEMGVDDARYARQPAMVLEHAA